MLQVVVLALPMFGSGIYLKGELSDLAEKSATSPVFKQNFKQVYLIILNTTASVELAV